MKSFVKIIIAFMAMSLASCGCSDSGETSSGTKELSTMAFPTKRELSLPEEKAQYVNPSEGHFIEYIEGNIKIRQQRDEILVFINWEKDAQSPRMYILQSSNRNLPYVINKDFRGKAEFSQKLLVLTDYNNNKEWYFGFQEAVSRILSSNLSTPGQYPLDYEAKLGSCLASYKGFREINPENPGDISNYYFMDSYDESDSNNYSKEDFCQTGDGDFGCSIAVDNSDEFPSRTLLICSEDPSISSKSRCRYLISR